MRDDGHPADHGQRSHDRAEDGRGADEDGPGDARQDTVRQGVTDEGQAAQHHEGAHDGAGGGDEHPGEERTEHELVVDEGVDERAHASSRCSAAAGGHAREVEAVARHGSRHARASAMACARLRTNVT